jgi:DedD protein
MDIRDLEQIRERQPLSPLMRLVYWVLGAAGAGGLVVGVLAGRELPSRAERSTADPLGDLVNQALERRRHEVAPNPYRLGPDEASFADLLVDQEAPSTALVAVKDERGELIAQRPALARPIPPLAQVEPLPSSLGQVLTQTELTAEPLDPLTRAAAGESPNAAVPVESGAPGGYQLQISSFPEFQEASRVADELRRRGHPAHIETADIPGRGTWHRVRLGPYAQRADALRAKRAFEDAEGVVTLLIDPTR